MSEPAKHTPGPWKAEMGDGDEPDRWIIVADGPVPYHIATIENGQPGDTLETEAATARTLAAAPDMLKALEEIRDLVGGESEDPDQDIARMQDIASAAIAKAEGREGA